MTRGSSGRLGHSTRPLEELVAMLRAASITTIADVRRFPGSPHTAWRNASFRAYADYMDTDESEEGVTRVTILASSQRVALMCSEPLWWQCHRSLIADYLKVRGYCVIHLLAPNKHEEHPYTSAAQIVAGRLSDAAH